MESETLVPIFEDEGDRDDRGHWGRNIKEVGRRRA